MHREDELARARCGETGTPDAGGPAAAQTALLEQLRTVLPTPATPLPGAGCVQKGGKRGLRGPSTAALVTTATRQRQPRRSPGEQNEAHQYDGTLFRV